MTIPMNYELVRAGDWISGTTQHDEKFIGFVQAMNDNGTIVVLVTQSDREEIIGTDIRATLAKVKKLPEPTLSSIDEVRSLIEIALATHDKEWFEQLRAELAILSTTVSKLKGVLTITNVKGRF